MEKQLIVAISREFGSGGHEIAEKIAKELGIEFYDRSMLDETANEMNVKVELVEKYDEKPKSYILSRRVGKYTNSMEEIIAETQFDFIKKKAEKGDSFVIVGRCAESVLRDFDGLITIFIGGEKEHKKDRVMKKYDLNETEAVLKMNRHDRRRKTYYNRHSNSKWGDSRHYDVCMNSTPLGIDGTVKVLVNYIQERIGKEEA